LCVLEIINYSWDVDNPLTYKNRMGYYKTRTELSFIKRHIPNNILLKILDIGGGSGRFAIPLKEEGHDVTVIDRSLSAINLCHRKGFLKAYCTDAIEFQSSEKYDFAIAIEVVEYFENFPTLLNKIREISDDKIKFVFTTHNKNSWRFRIRALKKNKTEYNKYYLKDYLTDLNNCGFSVIEIKGFLWMPFRLSSNSILIPFFEKLENLLKLNRWIGQSPWLLIAVEKI